MKPIVTFYNCDPKDAPRTTQGAHLGANAILTWNGKLLLEKRRDSDIWGMVGGGCKKRETGRDAIAREVYEELGVRIPKEALSNWQYTITPAALPPTGTAASGGW